MPRVLEPPPFTPEEPVTELLHGVEITDPYRWLEDQNSPRTRKWIDEQTAYARAYLDAIPGRDRIRKRVEELLTVEVISEPWKVGNRYFYSKRAPLQEQSVIMMRDGRSGEDVVLVDPTERREGSGVAVSILGISNDGKLLAYGVKQGGHDSQSAEFFDVDRKKVLLDSLPLGFGPSLVFSLDGRGLYYSHEMVASSRPYYRAVYWHKFGTRLQDDLEVFVAGEDPNVHVGVLGSSDGRHLAYLVTISNDPITFNLYLQDLTTGGGPRKVVERIQGVFEPFFAHNKLFALTDRESPNLRIVALDPEHLEHDYWRDIVPESRVCIKSFTSVGNFVCVNYVEDASCYIDVFDLTGNTHGRVPCPSHGTARFERLPIESDTLFYSFSSFDQPTTTFSYDPVSGEQQLWAKNQVVFEPSSIQFKQVRYESKDGTTIPMFLVTQNEKRLSESQPVFLTAYGGFGASLTPQFNAYSTFLAEHGFLVAIANIRGGGEFGAEWHRAAKRHNRQNAIDDFISAAEWLIAEGHTVQGGIAIGGGSNAGLLVGAALTQRPDLFRAVVCLGPLLDMLRYHLFDSAGCWVDEYGCSEKQEDFPHLLAYSPYHRIEEDRPYPAVMFVSGDADTRCNPMHARKMSARLQAATNSGRPILLDYRAAWGHAPVQPLTRRIDALTDRLAFICHELGVS